MAQVTINLNDRTLTSSYWAYYYDSGVKEISTPTTTTSSAQSFTVPVNSSINWVRIYCSLNSPAHGSSIRMALEGDTAAHAGLFSNGTLLDKSLFTAGLHSVKFRFKSGTAATTYPGYPSESGVYNSSSLSITNIRIVIDYNPPTSGLTLNKTSCPAGSVIRASVSAAASSYTHKVKFAMSGVTTLTYSLAAGVAYKDFTVPLNWQEAIPSATSRTVTVTLETYNGSTLTGDVSKTFTMTLSGDNYPSITAFQVTRIPGFTDTAISSYVQGFSRARFTGAAVGLYGASIASYKYTLGTWTSAAGAEVESPVLVNTGTRTATLEVTDSRGRKSSKQLTFEVIPYAPPSLVAPLVRRSNDLGNAAVNGTYAYIRTGVSFSSLNGVNTASMQARLYFKGSTPPAWEDPAVISLAENTPVVLSDLFVSSSYTVDILVTDRLGNYLFTSDIPTAKALLTGISAVKGAGIGLFAERENACTSAWPYWVYDDPVCHTRVGDVRISRDPTSPALIWPWTSWYKLPEETFLMAAGAHHVPGGLGDTGGAATHTLTEDELPPHGHGQRMSGANYLYNHVDSSGSGSGGTATGCGDLQTLRTNRLRIYTADAGGGKAHNNLPPYRSYHIWERTA